MRKVSILLLLALSFLCLSGPALAGEKVLVGQQQWCDGFGHCYTTPVYAESAEVQAATGAASKMPPAGGPVTVYAAPAEAVCSRQERLPLIGRVLHAVFAVPKMAIAGVQNRQEYRQCRRAARRGG